MSKEQMTINLDFTDPLLRGHVRQAIRDISDAVIWLAEDVQESDNLVNTFADELRLTRLFCGVALAAAQAMIDGARVEG